MNEYTLGYEEDTAPAGGRCSNERHWFILKNGERLPGTVSLDRTRVLKLLRRLQDNESEYVRQLAGGGE